MNLASRFRRHDDRHVGASHERRSSSIADLLPSAANIQPFAGLIKVYHSSEISLVFQTYPGGPINPTGDTIVGALPVLTPPTAQQAALSQYMNGAWANFAKNPMAGPGWNKLGTFDGNDLAVLGGSDGKCGGAQVIERYTVDHPCQALLPAFRAATGDVYGLNGAQ